MTQKYTTGSPHFIETGHLEPAPVTEQMIDQVKKVVFHALDSLLVENGASHSELKIDAQGRIRLIEIGARMGGDFIGSHLVQLSTGIDFVKAVIDVAMGQKPVLSSSKHYAESAVRFIFSKDDASVLYRLRQEHPESLIDYNVDEASLDCEVSDSSGRHGYFLMASERKGLLEKYLPADGGALKLHG